MMEGREGGREGRRERGAKKESAIGVEVDWMVV